ncbi:cytochrome c [Sagittula sp. NFXS13]|uniref:c-type cytochrome n=1 Tax=Sagittula sp. NFXS13 TaxID=2819095 RepID=UPI0032DFC009
MMRIAALAAICVAGPACATHELDARDLQNGQAVYAESCAMCHGAALEGQPDWQIPNADGSLPAPPHDETGHTWHHSNAQNFDYVKYGGAQLMKRLNVTDFTSGMPGFGDTLSDDDIWDVLAYIRSQWPEEIQIMQAGRNPPHE